MYGPTEREAATFAMTVVVAVFWLGFFVGWLVFG